MSGGHVERSVEILSTYVGPHRGRAAVDAHARKLGPDLERLEQPRPGPPRRALYWLDQVLYGAHALTLKVVALHRELAT